MFPSSILSVVPTIVEMLDDAQVDANGVSVSDYCRRVIWTCLVEDTALFLRHFLEKLTVRNKQVGQWKKSGIRQLSESGNGNAKNPDSETGKISEIETVGIQIRTLGIR
jgi:hydrogenase maturation factor HypE